MSERARTRLVREVTRTTLTKMKELQGSSAKIRETLLATVVPVPHLDGRVVMRKPQFKKTHIKV